MISNTLPPPRPFVVGDYVEQRLVAIPTECPCWCTDEACDVVVHGLRPRKTGPSHPIAVGLCHAHALFFTIYPPGFTPYARLPLLPLPDRPAAQSFASVAQDAADGVPWPREASGGSARWWSTQRRLLERLARVFGAFEAVRVREAVSLALGLPLRLLARLADAVGYRQRGGALVNVLAALHGDLDRVLSAGARTGAWGEPFRWQLAPPRLVPLSFVPSAKPSTTSEPRGPPRF